jgi:hypothetical protein
VTAKSETGFKRLLFGGIIALGLLWAGLELLRYRAEHRTIPVFVMIYGPPKGPMATQFAAAGITNLGMPTPYADVANPPVLPTDIAAIKHCLARERFFPLFPKDIQISGEDVEACYEEKLKRRTSGFRRTVILFAKRQHQWRIARIEERSGEMTPIRPWKWWEKVLDFVPFVD